jgi:hypothetical protein
MARNLLVTMTRGETGKVLWFKFEPTNDSTGVPEALDLTGATVTLRLWKGSTVHLDNVACTPDADQETNTGEGTFTFSEEQALVPVNGAKSDWSLRFHAVKDGRDYYFPTLTERNHAVLRVFAQ